MENPALSLSDIRLSLSGNAGRVDILRGIDLEIGRGETVGIVGPSGSGKSSLLMIMAGLERPSSGRIVALDRDIGTLNEDALARFRSREMGIVFQSFHLIPTMTALENVATPLELAEDPEAFAKAETALGSVGMVARAAHYPAELSGGEQQRVALARATVTGPGILLADEPTGNLDGATGTAIIDRLFGLQEAQRTTLILITHDEALAARCGRVIRMRDGLIAEDSATPAVEGKRA